MYVPQKSLAASLYRGFLNARAQLFAWQSRVAEAVIVEDNEAEVAVVVIVELATVVGVEVTKHEQAELTAEGSWLQFPRYVGMAEGSALTVVV